MSLILKLVLLSPESVKKSPSFVWCDPARPWDAVDCRECFLHVGGGIISTADHPRITNAPPGPSRATRAPWVQRRHTSIQNAEFQKIQDSPPVSGLIRASAPWASSLHLRCSVSQCVDGEVSRVTRAPPRVAVVAQRRPAVFIIHMPTCRKHS